MPRCGELAAQELATLERRHTELRQAVLLAMLPPDPTDSRNTVMEIRAGTGGEEAALFAAEGSPASTRSTPRPAVGRSNRWHQRERARRVQGGELPRHRPERLPPAQVRERAFTGCNGCLSTEASGRIHTSTVTVAVLPEAEEVDVQIDPQDLEITVQRASGAGRAGCQHHGFGGAYFIHKPTGMIVFLRRRPLAAEEQGERGWPSCVRGCCSSARTRSAPSTPRSVAARSGTGEPLRADPPPTISRRNRVTDHRIGLTLYNLPHVMEGSIDEIITALQRADFGEKLAALTGQPYEGIHGGAGDD